MVSPAKKDLEYNKSRTMKGILWLFEVTNMLTLSIKNKITKMLGQIEKKLPIFNLIPGSEAFHLRLQAQDLGQELDKLEQIPIKFRSELSMAPQEKPFCSFLFKARTLLAQLAEFSVLSEVSQELRRKTLALEYRLTEANGGCSPKLINRTLFNRLRQKLGEWKLDNSTHTHDIITAHDLLSIHTASRYHAFASLLLEDSKLFHTFALWAIRDRNSVEVFIEYPERTRRLCESNLSGRIGRLGGQDLKIQIVTQDNGLQEKIVTLPFEGKWVSILDEEITIVFRGHYALKIREIFNIFKNKDFFVGNLEYMANGIVNWNIHRWAEWDAFHHKFKPIDLTFSFWWEQLPLFEILSSHDVEERYGIKLDGKMWCASAVATRLTKTLDYENTHAYMEVAIPRGDGSYGIYDFGKFATKFPGSFMEALSIFCHNLHATIAYPDENVYYSHRESVYHPFLMTPEQGLGLMEIIRKDMLKGLSGNFVYQIESENCAKWVHESLGKIFGMENIPHMFQMRLLDTEPSGAVHYIFKLIRKLPQGWQTPILTFCHIPMGALKETWIFENGRTVSKSLTNHEFWETGVVYLPALLHKFKEEGFLPFASGAIHILYKNIKENFFKLATLFTSSEKSMHTLIFETIHPLKVLKTNQFFRSFIGKLCLSSVPRSQSFSLRTSSLRF
jgi:hypothetical protein